MVFNSISFLIFFLFFFILYWKLLNKTGIQYRNLFILLSSYFFYAWWDWRFLGLIFISSIGDYSLGWFIHRSTNIKLRKLYLFFSLALNLGLLGFFKYYNFFVESFVSFLEIFNLNVSGSSLEIILPVGISFYTFQTLSYSIDIYYRRVEPTRDLIAFFAFVSFFPQLVAGPIERARNLLPQFLEKNSFSSDKVVSGMRIVLWGFVKKLIFADNFGLIVDRIFDPQFSPDLLTLSAGTLFFAFQIYFDFSGYSDIAIGISRMLGFDLMRNFRSPYFSASLREFWRRWHISLSTWFRDYVYIPLGGNKSGQIRTNLNLFITFLISGIWHGADITFMLWGALHGFFLIVEKKLPGFKNTILNWLITFILVVALWLPFRAENLDHLAALLKNLSLNLSANTFISILYAAVSKYKLIALLAMSFLFFLIDFQIRNSDINEYLLNKSKIFRWTFYLLALTSIALMINFDVKPDFIYFQF